MPEAITIKEEPTTPLSLEDQNTLQEVEKSEETSTPETPELLAGKYKSVEELEKGYQELQQKLGKGETTEEVSESEPEQQEETTSDPREIYGEVIGSKLDEAGIDFGDMNTRWQESGQLTNEDYTDEWKFDKWKNVDVVMIDAIHEYNEVKIYTLNT